MQNESEWSEESRDKEMGCWMDNSNSMNAVDLKGIRKGSEWSNGNRVGRDRGL